MSAPDFWDDNDKAQKLISEMNGIKSVVDKYQKLQTECDDLSLMQELIAEEGDESLVPDWTEGVNKLEEALEQFELTLLLNSPYDKYNAILELHPGAGGTESQDWAQMLLRVYRRYAEKRGYKVEVLDYLPGDVAGVKCATLGVEGHHDYGSVRSAKVEDRMVR